MKKRKSAKYERKICLEEHDEKNTWGIYLIEKLSK